MKVLAINSNYINQNYKKKNVNFEAVRVNADAMESFRNVAPASSLTENLMYWVGRNYLGKKVEAVVRAITGIQADVPLENVFKKGTGVCSDVSKIKQDVFVHAEYGEGELGRLQSAIDKAKNEAFIKMPLREDEDAYKPLDKFKLPEEQQARAKLATQIIAEQQVKVFDLLWDEEGTECNKLKQLVEGFIDDANSNGHHVKNEDIVPFATELSSNVRTYEESKKGIDEAKKIADKTVTDKMTSKWFTPKPAVES